MNAGKVLFLAHVKMKSFRPNITLVRLGAIILGILLLWIIVSPKSSHSVFHVEIIFGLSFIIAASFAIEYIYIRTTGKDTYLSKIEIAGLVALLLLWGYFQRSFP